MVAQQPSPEEDVPLTAKGRKIKAAMKKTYGATKGTRVFYAWQNKHKKARTHKPRRRSPRGRSRIHR